MLGRDDAKRIFTDKIGTPIALAMGRLGVTPNALTVFGVVIAGSAAYLASIGQFWGAGAILLFSSVFDLFDGALARATGRVSSFGALLDSSIDRVSEAVVFLGLLAYYLARDNDQGVILVYLALAGSMMVSYVRARSEGLGIECRVGIMTRTERVMLMIGGLIVGHWLPAALLIVLGVVAALSMVTAGHRLLHASATFRKIK
ncbi:MAG: CDP-alcohol phosphatidyltransferase family protein [Chloroflexi bacterium]|nr:CDP-alcohol phosphatidyltransferase family protein [Chloroflexota bacterium]MCH8310812.1 CDP-alcohol phosphatidyltransferase family protein [Chloroflexota bacterium]